MEPIWAVGLMTGTVLDGNIDVALIKTDGERIADFGTYTLAPYPQSMRALLEETLRQARAWNFEGPEPAIFRELRDIASGRVPSLKGRHTVERLHEVRVNPGAVRRSWRKGELAISLVGGIITTGWLRIIEEDFEVSHFSY